MKSIILASNSARRKELLAQIGIVPNLIISSEIDETPLKNEGALEYAKRIAYQKAVTVNDKIKNPEAIIIAADTVVSCCAKILGKPKDINEAQEILNIISGRRHKVYTAVCIINNKTGRTYQKSAKTMVQFKHLSSLEIKTYLDSNEWQDKAGAYAIQGLASAYIKQINGSYSNVVGLPLFEVNNILQGIGAV